MSTTLPRPFKTILLVEDDSETAAYHESVLKNAGYQVIISENGDSAVSCVREGERIDLVLMDIDLGHGMNGCEAARQILELKNLPVLFLTAHGSPERVQMVHSIRRYGYVLKSNGSAVLLSSIESALHLHSLLQEKELLLKEVHHRVKNDLLFISSMLKIQSSMIEEECHTEALEAASSRLSVITKVYNQLYEGSSLKYVSAREMMEQIIGGLRNGSLKRSLHFDLQVEELQLPCRLGIAVGITANELLTNSMKYKNNGTECRISLSLNSFEEQGIELTVCDNGPGFPTDVLGGEREGFGFTVIRALSQQYNGFMEIDNIAGAVVRVVMEVPE